MRSFSLVGKLRALYVLLIPCSYSLLTLCSHMCFDFDVPSVLFRRRLLLFCIHLSFCNLCVIFSELINPTICRYWFDFEHSSAFS